MTSWANEVAGHPARLKAQEALTLLEQIRGRLEDAEALAEWDRIHVLVTQADASLGSIDPNRLAPSLLERLDDALAQVVGALQSALATPEDQRASLSAAVAPGHSLAEVLASWPPLPQETAADQMRASIEGVRLAAESAITNMEARLQATAAKSDDLRQALSEASARSDEALQRLRDQVAELSSTIASDKARLDEAIRAHQATFDQDQTQRQSDYTDRVGAAEEAFRSAQSAIETESRAKAEAGATDAEAHLATLEGFVERAKEQVGVIGRTGMSAGYQKDADKEERAADLWRIITVLISIAAATLLGFAVYVAASDGSADPTQLIGKALLSAALGGIATYTARQSGHHRANARAARDLELKLLSIGSYLEPLDAERQRKVLEVFAYLLFTGSTDQGVDDGVAVGPTNIQTLIEKINSGS